jgi:hypothetical protein
MSRIFPIVSGALVATFVTTSIYQLFQQVKNEEQELLRVKLSKTIKKELK